MRVGRKPGNPVQVTRVIETSDAFPTMLEVTVALFVVLFALWLRWRWKHTSLFLELGIPGPKPSLLFGNLPELYWKGLLKCQKEWLKKYGNILGYYYGMRPIIMIADPHIIKMVLIKDFNKFFDRSSASPLRNPNPRASSGEKSVLLQTGQKWKEIRTILTPSFTTSKMKQMAPLIHTSVERLMSKIEKNAQDNKEFNTHDLFQRLTMEVICRTAFGLHLDIQNVVGEPHALKSAQLIFDVNYATFLHFVALSFPFVKPIALQVQSIFQALRNRGITPRKKLLDDCEKVINLRRSNPQIKANDLLQLMLDAKIYGKVSSINNSKLIAGEAEAEDDSEINMGKGSNETEVRTLTNDEVKFNSFAMFIAGYETTSTALTFTSQLLVHRPDVQDKIYNEVNEVLQQGKTLDYNSVNQLKYLDMVFSESLRIYPPVINFVNRFANDDVRYKDFIIPKGIQVEIPVYAIHHDPELWPHPEIFDPERFVTKPNSDGLSYVPFGGGPRNCLGMRFAQMEAKLTLAHILHKFKFVPGEHTEKNLTVTARFVTQAPTYGVWVKAVPREKET